MSEPFRERATCNTPPALEALTGPSAGPGTHPPEPGEVTELRGIEGGSWAVHTRRSVYLFYLDTATVTRVPGATAPTQLSTTERGGWEPSTSATSGNQDSGL